jgi:hypothetical protein
MGLTAQGKDDHPRWDKSFNDLATCLSIDFASITADDAIETAPVD